MNKQPIDKSIPKEVLKAVREAFIESGGMDGRFKEKVVKSKKKYNRKKSKKKELSDLRFLYWE